MRILVITATYHPAINPNVFRWSAIAAQWVAQGHEVHVLCTRRSGSADQENIDGVRVHRSGQNSLLDWLYNLWGARQRRGEAGGDHPARLGSLRRLLEKLVDLTWRCLYWPDGRCLWYLPGKRKALALQREQPFDMVFSVGIPFTAHLIAGALKRRYPGVRWVMDIEDPFCFSEEFFVNNSRLYRRLNYRAESRMLRLADAVTVTVEQARRRYLELFPWLDGKISVAPPVFSMPEIEPLEKRQPDNKLHLAYFGAFYRRIRTPDALLAIFDKLLELFPEWRERLMLHFYGEIAPFFLPAFHRYPRLKGVLQLHGLLPREAVARAMAQSDILINVSNTTTYHLPSKCVDYLASGLPVINVCYHEHDPFNDFMADYPGLLPLVCNTEPNLDALAHRLHIFLNKKPFASLSPEALRDRLAAHRPEVLAAQYFSIAESGRRH